jgi:hypothetical protein
MPGSTGGGTPGSTGSATPGTGSPPAGGQR